MSNTRTFHDNGLPTEIALDPADIHIRPSMEERLSASYDQYEVLLRRHNRMEREADLRESRLMLLIVALVLLCTFCGSRWFTWEQRAIRNGWSAEVGR